MPRHKIIGYCSIEGCERPIKSLGICQYHYNKKRLEENPKKAYAGVRGHPFYMLWFERKQSNTLCWEWALDFKKFVEDISPKPEGEYFLVRLTNAQFGPDNFKWQEHLRRKENETAKDWNARKRANRLIINPNLESNRNIKRKFGMTREQYDNKLKNQNYVCAICEQPETSIDAKSNTSKRLAVDHCHKNKGIRDLLCWRCNGTLGKIEDNIELLNKMSKYLEKHQENICLK